ncbi:MAG: sulfatase [Planctomycetaceae bacterium]
MPQTFSLAQLVIRCLAVISTFLLFHVEELGADDASPKPNILMAFADDWGRYASAYAAIQKGGPSDLISTPNFDRIAREGVLFTNAFVNAPSCTPCRSSLLSGQYFWRTGRGAILLGAVWDETIPTYPLLLQNSGYHIGHTYKVWSPGTPPDAPYGGKATGYNRHGRRFNQFSQFVSETANHDAAKQSLLDEVQGNFEDFLSDRKADQPFCYWFGPTNTHRKWTPGSGKQLWGLNPDYLRGKLPPFLPDAPEIREDFADYLGEVLAFDAALGVLLNELEKRNELENTLIVVSGDHGIPGFPRGKCNLYDFGVAVPLAVRWGAKVPGGRVVDDFVCLPDLAPTFLEAGGVSPPEVMTGRSLLSVLTSKADGQVDPTRDSVITGRERHVASARHDYLPYPQRAIRTKDYLYVRNFKPDRWPMGTGPGFGEPDGPVPPFEVLADQTFAAFADLDASPTKAYILTHRDEAGMQPFVEYMVGRLPAEELYDIKSDPYCLYNLASDESHSSVRQDLKERLMTTLRDTGDPRVVGNGDAFDRAPFSDPFGTRRRVDD